MASLPAAWLDALAAEPHSPDFFARQPELRATASVEALQDEVLRVLYADPARAAIMARAAFDLAAELADPAARAAALRAMGHVSYVSSRYEEAVRFYGEALDILDALGRDRDAGRTLVSAIQPLIYLGRYDQAYAWAARAELIFQRLGDHLRLARLASNVGNILYRQDRYQEALDSYQRARATLGTAGEPRDFAAVLSNIAVCLVSLGQHAQALAAYSEARQCSLRHGLHSLVAAADYNIAYLHYLQGDFLRAIDLYKESREHCRRAADPYHLSLCDLDEAELSLELNLNREAAALAAQAASGFEALSMPYERAKAVVLHAIAACRVGQPRLSAHLFRQARTLFAAEKNRLWPALIDLYRAMLLEREGAVERAGRLGRRAHRALAPSILPGPAVLSQLLESRLLLHSGRVTAARQVWLQARDRLATASTPALRFHAHFLGGQIEERGGNHTAAFDAFESARREIDTLRSRLWGDEPKISFLKDKLAVYESLVHLCLHHRGLPSEAFRYIQQAKSRSLADLIALPPSPALPHPPLESEIDAARRDLDSHYRHFERLALSGNPSPAQVSGLRQSARESETRLARLLAETRPATPGNADPLSLDAIQASIPPDAVLLEYYIARGTLCVCLLDRQSLDVVPLGPAEPIRARLRLLRFQMRRFHLGDQYRRAVGDCPELAADTHLRELYDDLLRPLRPRLEAARHLIFGPHDFLHHLPFHALRAPDGYVIDRFNVSYAPSATVFALCGRGNPAAPPGGSLVFGIPDRLAPHIEQEARTAAQILPSARLFLGPDATGDVFRRYAPESRFIHIATHGMFRRDNPLFSAIRLGDSHLTLLDLYRLPLSAELVTLSGCSTGLNLIVGGDELIGLMRGLLLAGTRSVLVSLWDVNDLTTARFMGNFYRHLAAAQQDRASALRSAIQELRADYPHPYYWAPFLVAGEFTQITV
ncbi:MAG: CHAT domain-containing protein [Acidobacteria bacterium]|nr:CHAT domain-containing protein [Acidobacteriota bacterium]